MTEKPKIKVLIVTDSPILDTGMGIVHRNIGVGLHKKGFEVVSLAWSSEQSPGRNVPWRLYKTIKQDYYGSNIFDGIIKNERPDIVLTIGDIWTVDFIRNCKTRNLFQWVGYIAIDGKAYNNGIPPSWMETINDMECVITYTEYGKETILSSIPSLKDKIEIIPHGVDLTKFFPINKDKRMSIRKRHGFADDKILYLLVARNQFRKNIPEIFKAWARFTSDELYKDAILFPHMLFNDVYGYNLDELIKICGIKDSVSYFEQYAHGKNHQDTISDEDMNILYNISDVVVLLSGEGFGFPIVEAMACMKPLIVLNHSAGGELVGNKGELVDVDYYVTGIHLTERPYPSMESFIEKMKKLYFDEKLREQYGKECFSFIQEYSWDLVIEKWDRLLNKIANPFTDECKLERIS